MQCVVELPAFARQAERLFSAGEREALIAYVAANPLLGDEIPGTGGIRKLRFSAQGKGKQKGARVIYFWFSQDVPIFLMGVYAKGEQTDMSPDEKKAVTAFATAAKAKFRSR
jgi:hypothetical protein